MVDPLVILQRALAELEIQQLQDEQQLEAAQTWLLMAQAAAKLDISPRDRSPPRFIIPHRETPGTLERPRSGPYCQLVEGIRNGLQPSPRTA